MTPTIWVVRRICKNQLVLVVLNARRLQHLQPAVEGEGESEPEEEFKINTEWSANPTWQTANASAAAKSSQPKTELFAANIDAAKAREVSSTPLKFHDQIRALWEYDKMIQLSDVDVKQSRDQILHPPSI